MKKILTSNGKPLFKDGKLLASSRGGGSATVTTKAGWFGTTVPNTGHVDKVYFNTALSVEEVLNIITNIEYHTIEVSSIGIYGLLYSFPISIIIFKYSDEDYTIQSAEYGVIWSSIIRENDGRPKAGWYLDKDELTINLDVNNVVGDEVIDTNFQVLLGASVGEQNDKLSTLFSTTPFTYEEANEVMLTGDYDGSPVITDIVGGWQGTPVPNTGYVENVYFNTALSVEEVVAMLETLPYAYDQDDDIYAHILAARQSGNYHFGVMKNDGVFMISLGLSDVFFHNAPADSSIALSLGFVGWNPNITYPFNVEEDFVPSVDTDAGILNVGTMNDKLASLFSTTPFIYKEANTIDMKHYINEKKLPLKINVKGPKIVSGGGNASGTPIPSSGYIENIYVNVNTEPEELANKLDELLAGVGVDPAEGFQFPLFVNEDDTIFGGLFAGEGIYAFVIFLGEAPIYAYTYTRDSTKEAEIMAEVGFIGWNPALTDGVVPVNAAIIDISILLGDSFSMWEMAVKEITPFISSTPFVSSGDKETVELVGEYDGNTLVINELPKGKNIGTTVPNNEYVNKIYINPNITIDELRENLKKIELVKNNFDNDWVYEVFKSDNTSVAILISGTETEPENLDTLDSIAIVAVKNNEPIAFGTFPRDWQPDAEPLMPSVLDIKDSSQVGHQNYLLSSLFSITPYSEDEKNTINIKKLLEEKKLPLSIKVKVRSGNAVITTPKYIGTQVPNSGTVENVYFNTNLSVEETNDIITNAGFTVNQTYPILTKSDKSNAIVITNNSSGQYAILDAAFTAIYFHSFPENEADFGFIGWNPNITMPIAINSEVISELNGTPSGDLNNLITSLFSTAPFEVENEKLAELGGEYASTNIEITEDGIIDVLEIIDNQEAIPTKIITTSTKNFILGDISEYNDMYFLKEARVGLFAESNITSANLPYLEEIPQYMFYSCKELTAINCPKAEYIGKCAFYECKQLTSIDFPEASRIGDHAFYQSGIKNFNLPKVYEIDDYAFSWTQIEHFESSEVSNIGPYSFAVCYNLISVKLPKVTDLSEGAFEGCSVLKSVDLPAVTRIYGSAFRMCYELNNVKFPNLTKLIGDRIFASCKALTDLYFGKYVSIPGSDTVLTLPGHTVTIHVRSEHLEQYEAVGTSWHHLTVTGRVVIVGDYTD